jgi:hypothetical protein
MNNKQKMIFNKHLNDHLVPTKDKEKILENIERKKREEAKNRLEQLENTSKVNQTALKMEYQKFLNNQMKLREKKNAMDSEAKRDQLNEMKRFAAIEKEKDKQDVELK